MRARHLAAVLGLTLSLVGCDDASEPEPGPVQPSAGDVGTYQYFFLDSYRPLVVEDDESPAMNGQLWIYDGETGVPEHIDAYVMEPRPQSVIVTEAYPLEYVASDDVSLGVTGQDAEFRLMVVALDGWAARSEDRRETFDCVRLTPDGVHLTSQGEDDVVVDWETLESHGEPQILVLPRRTTDGAAAAGEDGQRLVNFDLRSGC